MFTMTVAKINSACPHWEIVVWYKGQLIGEIEWVFGGIMNAKQEAERVAKEKLIEVIEWVV